MFCCGAFLAASVLPFRALRILSAVSSGFFPKQKCLSLQFVLVFLSLFPFAVEPIQSKLQRNKFIHLML